MRLGHHLGRVEVCRPPPMRTHPYATAKPSGRGDYRLLACWPRRSLSPRGVCTKFSSRIMHRAVHARCARGRRGGEGTSLSHRRSARRNAESTAIQTDAGILGRTLTSIAHSSAFRSALRRAALARVPDAWAALFACVLIAANGWRLFYPALHAGAGHGSRAAKSLRGAGGGVHRAGVLEIDKCFVRKIGLEFYVDLHSGWMNGFPCARTRSGA